MKLFKKIIFGVATSFFCFTGVAKASSNFRTELNFALGVGAPLSGINKFTQDTHFKFANIEGKDLEEGKTKASIMDVYGLDFSVDFRFLSKVGVENYFLTGFGLSYRMYNGNLETKSKEGDSLQDSPTSWMIHRVELKLPLSTNFWEGLWYVFSPKVAFNLGGSFKSMGKDFPGKDILNILDYGIENELSWEFYGVRIGGIYSVCFASLPKKGNVDFLGHKYNDEDKLGTINRIAILLGFDFISMMEEVE